MRIAILYFILFVYIGDRKCFVDCTSTSKSREVSSKTETFEKYRQYIPLLDKSAEKYIHYEDVMKSAVDCLKFTIVFRFFSAWNIILMGIAYGLDQNTIKNAVDKVDREKLKRRSSEIARNTLPKHVYQKMNDFVELANAVEASSANVSGALNSFRKNLSDMLSSPVALAKLLTKGTIKDSAKSLRSCYRVFTRVLTDKELQQDFLDGVIYVRNSINESTLVRSVSKSAANYARQQARNIITKIETYSVKERKLDPEETENIEKFDSILKHTVENDNWRSQAVNLAKTAGKSILKYALSSVCNSVSVKNCIGK